MAMVANFSRRHGKTNEIKYLLIAFLGFRRYFTIDDKCSVMI